MCQFLGQFQFHVLLQSRRVLMVKSVYNSHFSFRRFCRFGQFVVLSFCRLFLSLYQQSMKSQVRSYEVKAVKEKSVKDFIQASFAVFCLLIVVCLVVLGKMVEFEIIIR